MANPPRTAWSRRECLRVALAGGVGLAGCSPPPPLRLGFIGGLSGRVADLGIGGRNGAQLAIDEANAAQGVRGRPIELLVRDDEQNDEVARKVARELVDAGVQAIIGPMTSSVAVAIAPIADERGLPMISPTATTDLLSGKRDNFFRVVVDAPTAAAREVEHLYRRGTRKLATVYDVNNRAFSESWAKAAATRMRQLGGEVTLELGFESAPGLSYAELATKVMMSDADSAMLVTNASDAAVLAQQLRQRFPSAFIATSSWAGTEQLIQMGGRGVEGALVPQLFDRESRKPAYLGFVESHRKRFGEAPGYPAVAGHDATTLIIRALRQREGGASLVETLRGIREHEGLQRLIQLDEAGDSNAPMFLTTVKGGRFVRVETS